MINGPFILRGASDKWWDICDSTGMPIVNLCAILIDGSSQKAKYPTGIIRTREQQKAMAEFTTEAMNTFHNQQLEDAHILAQADALQDAA